MNEVDLTQFLVIMIISLLVSMLISYFYLTFYKNRATGSQIHRAFPLIGVSITAIFICIQFSLPLSLGLLGALSIVRFRTPIKEPEEIGFILLVVATSICCATFNFIFLAVLLAIAFIGLILLNFGPRYLKGRLNDGILLIRIPSAEFKTKNKVILEYLEKVCTKGKIESVIEKQEESILSYSFIQIDDKRILKMQTELEELANGLKSNIFFNRIGEI